MIWETFRNKFKNSDKMASFNPCVKFEIFWIKVDNWIFFRRSEGGISIDADSGPLAYVLWCCGSSICHEVFTFIQIDSGHISSSPTSLVHLGYGGLYRLNIIWRQLSKTLIYSNFDPKVRKLKIKQSVWKSKIKSGEKVQS